LFLNILVGIDGSPSSQRALEYAIELARAERARLTLITVAPPAASFIMLAGVMPDAMREELDKWARGQLADAVRTVPDELNAHTVQGRGHPRPRDRKRTEARRLRLDRPRLPWSRAHAGRAPGQRQRLRPLPRARAAPLGAGRDGDQGPAQLRATTSGPSHDEEVPDALPRASELLAFQAALCEAAYRLVNLRAGLFDLLHVEPS
jgi:Universal stress protein family